MPQEVRKGRDLRGLDEAGKSLLRRLELKCVLKEEGGVSPGEEQIES